MHTAPNQQINAYWEWIQGTEATPSSEKYYLPTENRDPTSPDADNVIDRTTVYDSVGVASSFDTLGNPNILTASDIGTYYSKIPHPTNGSFTYETVTASATAYIITMAQWITAGRPAGNFWIADVDGWYYWASYLPPKTATGLLLDAVNRKQALTDDYYYGIKANLEATTFGEVDKFTDAGDGAPSADAKDLFAIISGNVITSIQLAGNWNAVNNTITRASASMTYSPAGADFTITYDPLVSAGLKTATIRGLGGTAGPLVSVSGILGTVISQPPGQTATFNAAGISSSFTVVGTSIVKFNSLLEPDKVLEVRRVRI
jgi:hypothetical protein